MRAALSLPAALRRHARAGALALARTVLRRPGLTRRLRALLGHLPGLQAYLYRMVLAAPPQPAPAPPPSDLQLSPRTGRALRQLRHALASTARQAERAASAPSAPLTPTTSFAPSAQSPSLAPSAPSTSLAPSTGAAPVTDRPKLAFVSPLPPERTGIADYAAQLLPALMAHFDITLVLQQDRVTLAPELAALPQRTAAWLHDHGDEFEHILYQFGNSPFHSHMFALLERHPGVVVLHDFFLSSVLAYLQLSGIAPGAWTDALFAAHGYPALRHSLTGQGANEALKLRYPCNLAVLQNARRVVVHSAHARALAQQWYGDQATANWDVVPLPRSAPVAADRASVRAALGIAPSTYLVCSFGFVTPSKLCHELVRAWLASTLHTDAQCQLLLVGANHGGDYGVQLSALLAGAGGRVRIAGWTDDARYRQYLQAADAAVQLRTASRGETSAAVLDCMNYGLPTIVNANGSMAALPDDCVLKLPDQIDEAALRAALEQLRADPAAAHALGARAGRWLHSEHRPEHCAALYAQALRQARADADADDSLPARLRALVRQPGVAGDEALQRQLAATLAQEPDPLAPRQLLVDVSGMGRDAIGDGAEAAARAELLALLTLEPAALRVEPVCLCEEQGQWRYRYARRYSYALLGLDPGLTWDPLADIGAGDVYYGLGCAAADVEAATTAGLYAHWRALGVSIQFALRDAPSQAPGPGDTAWLDTVAGQADRVLCASTAQLNAALGWLSRPERAPAQRDGRPALQLAAPHPDAVPDVQQWLAMLTGHGLERELKL